MTRNRVSKEEKQQRHEWAMKQIDKGVGFSELASLISETWGCTRRNARHVVSLAHIESLALKISNLQRAIEDRAGNLLDERDRMIQQRLWLQNELDNVGAV